MASNYYPSSLTPQEVDAALHAIDSVISPSNNGKILYINNGKIAAKSASEFTGGGNMQEKTVTPGASQQVVEPDSGYDGLSAVTVEGVIAPNLIAGNIKKDVVIKVGTSTDDDSVMTVTGSYEGSGGGGSSNDILFHFDSDFRNSGKYPSVFSSTTGLTISDEQSKFGSKSLKCGSSQGRYNVVLDPVFAFGTNDFTLDFWCYPTSLSTASSVPISFDYRCLGIYLRTTSINLCVAKTSSLWAIDSPQTMSFSTNQWYHIAVVRDGTKIYLFVNGTKIAEYIFGSDAIAPTKAMTVGSNTYSNGDARFNGYIDELRLILGTAVWTDDFTPPSQPYT